MKNNTPEITQGVDLATQPDQTAIVTEKEVKLSLIDI